MERAMNPSASPDSFEWVIECPVCKSEQTVSWNQVRREIDYCLHLECRYECDKCGCTITSEPEYLKKNGRWRNKTDLNEDQKYRVALNRSFSRR